MSYEDKHGCVESLLKATDILLGLMAGEMEPVPLRDYEKDGSEVRVYAHANGVFHLMKSQDGTISCDGLTVGQHERIAQTCQVAMKHILENAADFLKGGDPSELLVKHAGVMKLKKTLDRSSGVVQSAAAWNGNPAPKPGPKPVTDQFALAARKNATKPLTPPKHFTDASTNPPRGGKFKMRTE